MEAWAPATSYGGAGGGAAATNGHHATDEVHDAELRLARAEAAELQARLEEYETAALAQKYQLEHEKSGWAGERARLEARVAQLEAGLDGERRQLADELDAAHDVMHHANEDLKASFADLQTQCRTLERENARLKQQRSQWLDRQNRVPSGACAACQGRSRENATLTASKAALESEVRGLKRALAAAARAPAAPPAPRAAPEAGQALVDLKRENETLTVQLRAAQRELRMRSSEEDDVHIMSAEVQRLRQELDESRGPLDVSRALSQSVGSDAEDEVIVLKAHLETLSEEAAQFRKLADTSLEDANTAFHDARASFEMQRKLEGALQQALARLQELETDNARLRSNLEAHGVNPEIAPTPRTEVSSDVDHRVAKELHAEIRRLRQREVALEDVVARLRERLADVADRYQMRTGSQYGHDSRDGDVEEDLEDFVASLESEVHRSRQAIQQGRDLLHRSRQNQQDLDDLARAGRDGSQPNLDDSQPLHLSRVSFPGSPRSFMVSTPQRSPALPPARTSPLTVRPDPEVAALRHALGAEADAGMRIVAAVHKLKDALRALIDPVKRQRGPDGHESQSFSEGRMRAEQLGSPYKYADEMGGLTPKGAEDVARMRLSDVQMACEQIRAMVEGHLERRQSIEELRQYCEHLESMLAEGSEGAA